MKVDRERVWRESIGGKPIPYSGDLFSDCAGIFWPNGVFPFVPPANFQKTSSLAFPSNGDGFRAGAIEWEAMALAVYLAKKRGQSCTGGKAVAIELGASGAPWMLTFLKHLYPLASLNIKTVAIEAGNVYKLTRRFWEIQSIDFRVSRKRSSFSFWSENFESTFLRGIVASQTGKMYFPRVDISKDNGANAARKLSMLDRRGKRGFNKVKTYDVFKIIQEFSDITFLHMDIQGAEVELLKDSRFGEVIKRVSIMLIGTHSPEADNLVRGLDGKFGLTLISGLEMKPGEGSTWPVDGEFLLINDSAKLSLQEDLVIN